MDKFGIFNILNSFSQLLSGGSSSQNGQENQNLEEQFAPSSTPQQPKAKDTEKAEANAPAVNGAPYPPLQSSMLDTMKSHDEFVKRVVKKSNIKQ